MKKKLFNGAILHHPVDGDTQLLMLRTGFLATTEEAAKTELLRELTVSTVLVPSDQLEVIVRPF